ncbi:MAG: PASTA domain-containing protein [Endomicrobium sp.]|nr:PASTA domain-containing protein [Endomicrobium sp.]
MFGKFLKLLIAVAVAAAAFYFAFNMIMSALIRNKKEVVVPNIIGKSLYETVEELSNMGCGLKKESEEFNQNLPVGVIVRQEPPAGMKVKEGKVVKVSVSKGGETVYVPNLVGRAVRTADVSLKNSALVMGEVSKRYSVVADKGIILSQDIEHGSAVDKYSVVNVVVSDGSPPEGITLMPDFLNKNVKEAEAWAVQSGINININAASGGEVCKTDIIVKQQPEADVDITGVKSIDLWLG